VEKEVNSTAKQEFFCKRYLFQNLHLFSEVRLREQCDISVDAMEHEDVQAPDPVPFIEPSHALLVYPLESFKIRAVDRWTEGKSHT
jgi:hypothetical protein